MSLAYPSIILLLAAVTEVCHADMLASKKNYKVPQPDDIGSIDLVLRGNPRQWWEEDIDGYTTVDDEEGFKNYGKIDGVTGELVATNCRPPHCQPEKQGLEKHVKESMEVRNRKCGRFCDKPERSPILGEIKRAIEAKARGEGGGWGGQGQGATKDTEGNQKYSLGGPGKNEGQYGGGDDEEENKRRLHLRGMIRRSASAQPSTLMNLVVLMRFGNHVGRSLPPAEDYGTLFNARGGSPKICPTGSVKDYFLFNSYGSFEVNSEVHGWVDVTGDEAFFADGDIGITGMLHEAVREALDKIDETVDFDRFDEDGDKRIDSITIIHSGYGAEQAGVDCETQSTINRRIWSHKWALHPEFVSSEGVRVDNYHIHSGLWGACGSEIAHIGAISHGMGHFLGLPGLYDGHTGNGIGSFGLMGNAWGFDHSQLFPPMMSPWSKMELGWMTPTVLRSSGSYKLEASHSTPAVFMIKDGFKDGEYLLIEYRQKNTMFESLLPQEGLLIWHIDENKERWDEGGFPGQEGWPANGKHYKVAILPADGNYHLEHGRNFGDAGVMFHSAGRNSIGPCVGCYPNTDSYANGVITATNHQISNIGHPRTMTFDFVSGSVISGDPVTEKKTDSPNVSGSRGQASIYPLKDEFSPEESITIFFDNPDASEGDWIGIFDATVGIFEGTVASEPLAWLYTCGGKSDCETSPPSGEVRFPSTSIIVGHMRAFLLRKGNSPFKTIQSSRQFEVLSAIHDLPTTLQGGHLSKGVCFDISTRHEVEVRSLGIHCDATAPVELEVYTKEGTFKDHEENESAWNEVFRETVVCQGLNALTVLSEPVFSPVVIPASQSQAFYIFAPSEVVLSTATDEMEGSVFAQDSSLQVKIGKSVRTKWGETNQKRLFNGRVWYARMDGASRGPENPVYASNVDPDAAAAEKEVVDGGIGSSCDGDGDCDMGKCSRASGKCVSQASDPAEDNPPPAADDPSSVSSVGPDESHHVRPSECGIDGDVCQHGEDCCDTYICTIGKVCEYNRQDI